VDRSLVPGLLVFGVVLALAVGGLGRWQDRRRRRALARFCVAEGWSYVGRADSWSDHWRGAPFGFGHRRRCRNVIEGIDRTRRFVAFDYSYRPDSGAPTDSGTVQDSGTISSSDTRRFAVLCVTLPSRLPPVQVLPVDSPPRPDGKGDTAAAVDIGSEDFGRRFRVTSGRPDLARDVINARTVNALLAAPVLAWRIEGSEIVAWADGKLDPADLIVRLATLRTVADGIPDRVWQGCSGENRRGEARPLSRRAGAADETA
jgi:hypothetical protein